ncbi:MAG: type II toxin-antitoxin system HicA family toxin [Opitutaceae bacterium]|nr:type II toxin-antitoxin system HicA family toxin [Opitutaceae bacterium]
MPKLRPLPSTEICRILAAHGFVRERQSGSHIIMKRQLPAGDSATVPVPNHREVAKGTLRSIIALSGLDDRLFRK